MTSRVLKQVAFFKSHTTSSIPHRQGPVQCVRNCSRCIIDQRNLLDSEEESLLNFRSYDNLVARKTYLTIPLTYQTIQYHLGQVELLRKTLSASKDSRTIFIVGVNNLKDLDYFNEVLEYKGLTKAEIMELDHLHTSEAPANVYTLLKEKKSLGLPISLVNCFTTVRERLIDPSVFVALVEPLVSRTLSADIDINIVPVAITKDQEKASLLGVGSLCVQIMEPYSLKNYLKKNSTSSPLEHVLTHTFSDINTHSVILPGHLIAFLILQLEREEGVKFQDLVYYVDWFKKTSIFLNLHLGFTGESKDVVNFGLILLREYIIFNSSSETYTPKNYQALLDYSSPVIPNVLYHGIIATAIIKEYNLSTNRYLRAFTPDVIVRVEKEKVFKSAIDMADRLETSISCRRPCYPLETVISETYYQMENFGKYFKTEAPLIQARCGRRNAHWEGESDDEEYFLNNTDNPALKTWTSVTRNPVRLDRLNLFLNTVDRMDIYN